MDHLKEGIGLRGYGQHDPLVEYKRESFEMFEAMMERFEEETVRYLYLMQVIEPGGAALAAASAGRRGAAPGDGDGRGRWPPPAPRATSMDELEEAFQRRKRANWSRRAWPAPAMYQPVQQVVRSGAKVGRNDPCPCGSGKKYKKCCGVSA